VGKSSLVAELGRQLKEEGWFVVSADVQHTADEAAFLQEIQDAIQQTGIDLPLKHQAAQVIRGFRHFMRGAKVSAAGAGLEVTEASEDWESAAAALKRPIRSLPEKNRRVLTAVDELPIFLTKLLALEDGPPRLQAVLDWLRSVRQATGRKVPWILCGSIGLDSFVAKHGLEGSINEMLPLPVDAIERTQAIELLKRLGARPEHTCPISDDVAQMLVNRAGWLIPYYLQLLFHGLKTLSPAKRSSAFPCDADIEAAYETLLGPHHRTHFGHWDSRLGDLLEQGEEAAARLLLDHLAGHPAGRTRDQLKVVLVRAHAQADPAQLDRMLRDLLDFLERDGYLGQLERRYAFRSFLLRDYWQRRFGS